MNIIQLFKKNVLGLQNDAERVTEFTNALGVATLGLHEYRAQSIWETFIILNSAGIYSHVTDSIYIRDGLDAFHRLKVILHEVAHWTGKPGRCDRPWMSNEGRMQLQSEGKDLKNAQGFEECVADMGAKLLWEYLGLSSKHWDETYHQNYLAHHGIDVRGVEAVKLEAVRVVEFCKRHEALARLKERIAA